ncbi:MAG: hypothetical protein KAS86_03505 [Candidatus Omnitrophica bacterium]|nr:hypothetical protein [Candidatus Omnitrophota bacterium]
MKNMTRTLIVIFALGIVPVHFLADRAECREYANLYERFSKKEVVKIHVSDVTDSTGGLNMGDLEALRGMLENALVTRMTINFEPVPDMEEADIAVSCDITEFLWTEDDPIDMITGIGPILMDAMIRENYTRLQAVFTVTDPGRGRTLWRKKLKATITDKKIPESESVSMAEERLVKVFMRECFSKTHGRRR